MTPIEDRVRANSLVDPESDCWQWTGKTDREGYGTMWIVIDGRRRVRFAHRMSYAAMVGELEEGLVIDHLCENKSCVNPDHLEQVTPIENTRRYWSNRDMCGNGLHEINEENMIFRGHKRQCRACHREYMREWRARKKTLEVL